MAEALVDTDIVSELLRGRNARVRDRARDYVAQNGPFAVSVLTLMEFAKGFEKAGRPGDVDLVLARLGPLRWFALTMDEARLGGTIHGSLERGGVTIGRVDPMIAATALVHDLTLVTGNVEHYERIRALGHPLRIENWRD